MSPPTKRSARGANPGAAKTDTAAKQPSRLQDSAEVFGTRLLAAGDAHFDRVLVRRCCWCGRAHIHIAFEGPRPTIERSPSCAKHRTYVVTITDVVPAVPEPARGAA